MAIGQKARTPQVLFQAWSLLNVVENSIKTSLTQTEQFKLMRWAVTLPHANIRHGEIKGPRAQTVTGEKVIYADWQRINVLLQEVFGPEAGHPVVP
jgi:anionic cell wall polymer biosynthesis LytR-Cps2A-Psr (LCP) family protein